jgi:hypothetical protein
MIPTTDRPQYIPAIRLNTPKPKPTAMIDSSPISDWPAGQSRQVPLVHRCQ